MESGRRLGGDSTATATAAMLVLHATASDAAIARGCRALKTGFSLAETLGPPAAAKVECAAAPRPQLQSPMVNTSGQHRKSHRRREDDGDCSAEQKGRKSRSHIFILSAPLLPPPSPHRLLFLALLILLASVAAADPRWPRLQSPSRYRPQLQWPRRGSLGLGRARGHQDVGSGINGVYRPRVFAARQHQSPGRSQPPRQQRQKNAITPYQRGFHGGDVGHLQQLPEYPRQSAALSSVAASSSVAEIVPAVGNNGNGTDPGPLSLPPTLSQPSNVVVAAGLPLKPPTSSPPPPPFRAGSLKVLSLNAWGLNWPWSEDRNNRIKALKDIIALNDYDIILLQEVWFRRDYDVVRSSVPYASYFESFNSCSGYFLPMGCSGLIVLSRHPIEHVEFLPFSFRGSFWNFDGEIFVGKGVGKARVRWQGLAVDVFTSHFVSYTNNPNSDNKKVRYMQSKETVAYINNSDADIKLFGADINALPTINNRRTPYYILTTLLKDALTDRYPDASFHPWFATYGNSRNTYTRGAYPERIDLLMFWARPGLAMRTKEFVMPMFMTRSEEGELISLSDHEALLADFEVAAIPAQKSNTDENIVDQEQALLPSPSMPLVSDTKVSSDYKEVVEQSETFNNVLR